MFRRRPPSSSASSRALSASIAVALKNKFHWDDALDVWGVHGVGGFIGIILLGIFADKTFNPDGVNGWFYGDRHFFVVQCIAVVISTVWAFLFTYIMLLLIDVVTPVKVTKETEEMGLDAGLHGETAYLEA